MSIKVKHAHSPAKQGILVSEACCSPDNKFCLPAKILSSHGQATVEALIVSRAEKNLISQDLVDQLQLTTQTLPQLIPVAGVTGRHITHISQEAIKVQLIISGNHRELSEFMIFHSSLLNSFWDFRGYANTIQVLTGLAR